MGVGSRVSEGISLTLKSYATPIQTQAGFFLKMDPADKSVSERILAEALSKGKRVRVEIGLEVKRRTQGQNALYWATLPTLFLMVNDQFPTREELEDFHEDFKTVHGLRRPSSLDPSIMVPVRMRDADTQDAKTLLDALFAELSEHGASASFEAQSKARDAWRTFWVEGGQTYADEADFRRKARLCAGCGHGGRIELAHIVSRGADHSRIDDPTNWLPLCPTCHAWQHQYGWTRFVDNNPHLKPRWESAQKCA